jgi:hypothetical protein
MAGDQPTSGAQRSGAVTAAGVVLPILTTPYALLAAVFGAGGLDARSGRQFRQADCARRPRFRSHGVVPGVSRDLRLRGPGDDLSVARLAICGRDGRVLDDRARLVCAWIWLAGRIPGFSPVVPVVLFAIAGFVLWAVRRERKPA